MKRAHTVALVAALYLVSMTPSYSQDIFGLIQNMAGKYAVSWADLETRRAQLEVELNAAATQRKITAEQAADFRADLAQLTTDINQNKASGRRLGIQASIAYSNQLSSLATALSDAIQKRVASLPDVDALQVQLKSKIDAAATSGQMSAQTATTLRAELQQIEAIEAAYKADTGATLTTRQIELLSERLNALKASVEQEIRVGQSAIPALNDRRASIQTKIEQGSTSGKLTPVDADVFRRELTTLAEQQRNFIAAGNGVLTGQQVLTLAQGLDRLDDRLSARIGGTAGTVPTLPTVSTAEIDRMRERIVRRVNRGVENGTITELNARAMLRELDRLADLEAAFQATPGGISSYQVARLEDDLADLNVRVTAHVGNMRDNDVIGGGGGGGLGGFGGPGGFGGGRGGLGGPGGPGGFGGGRGGRGGRGGNGGPIVDAEPPVEVAITPPSTRINLPVIAQKSFSDIRGYWGEPYVAELASREVIGGFPNGTFGPNDDITRAQFAAIVVKALGLPPASGGKVFVDVPSNHWAANAIATASNAGLIGGFPDGTFGPAQSITRAQALVILSKALGSHAPAGGNALSKYTDAAAVPSWAQAAINQSANANIIVSFPDASQIRPNATATRGEVAGLMYQTLNALGANLPPVRIGVMASNH